MNEDQDKNRRARQRRLIITRTLGDAAQPRAGAGTFLGDTTRSAGVEVEMLDEDDPRAVFVGS